MLPFADQELEALRDELRTRGQRPSIVMQVPSTSRDLIDALQLVEEWGPFCEAMYLMMAADRRVLNVEREVLRGALATLSGGTVRTRHMEAMLDAAMRKVAKDGVEARLRKVIDALRGDPARAETAVVVAAAIAAADKKLAVEEHALLTELMKGLEIDEKRTARIFTELKAKLTPTT